MTYHADQQLVVPADADPLLEQVLLGLADGCYVLSTPDGAVAECGAGVVGLLAAPAERLVGRPVAEVLAGGGDDASRIVVEQQLHASHVDPADRPAFAARSADGTARSLELVVVAVPLALGWEFTSLLSELRARDAGTWRPEALRTRHGRALDAIESVVRNGTQPDPSARLAGILILVRDVDAPPLTREDVDRRMADQRAAAREASAEAARCADEAAGRLTTGADADADAEGDGADEPEGLDGLVERARILRERVEEAERDAATAQLERDQALARLAESEAARDAANARLQETGGGRADELTHERDAARAQLAALQEELDAARAELQARDGELHTTRAELSAHADDLRAANAELAATANELRDARLELAAREEELAAVRTELPVREEALDEIRAELADRDEQLQAMRHELDAARTELDATRAAAADVRAEREQAQMQAQELLAEAEKARAAAEAIRAEFSFDPAATPPEQRAPWAVPRPLAAAPSPAHAAQQREPKPELPAVAPGQAAALISLDGSFKRLDDAFCSLLGCREEDLRAARWPSIIDRENLAAHEEVARALQAGQMQSAEIETVYMHAQGLLVPIAGTISLHRADPAGAPTHFLFRADVSRTAGAPGMF